VKMVDDGRKSSRQISISLIVVISISEAQNHTKPYTHEFSKIRATTCPHLSLIYLRKYVFMKYSWSQNLYLI
jgi:hypothetical protein